MSEGAATLGRRLTAEREHKSLSVQKVADELHLDGWVIEALESGDHARLGPAVYGKGHLKRYLALLGLPPAEMEGAYSAEAAAVDAPQPATLRMRMSAAGSGNVPWLPPAAVGVAALAVTALAVGAVSWWHPWHARAVASPASLASAAPSRAGESGTAQEPSNALERDSSRDEAAANGEAVLAGGGAVGGRAAGSDAGRAPSASGATPAESDHPAGTGRARLRLSFSSESWVDVHDAVGQRVYAGTGRANSVKTIVGAAPLRVYLRSASGVQLEINDHAVAIGSRFVVGNVARFEAGADGVLRRDSHALGVAGTGILRRDPHAAGTAGAASSGAHPRG